MGVTTVNGIAKTDDGYVLAGATEVNDVGYFDAWLLKVDKNGNRIWDKRFGGRERDVANSVIAKDGSYIMAGSKGYHTNSIAWARAWIIKCNDYPPPEIKIVRPKENYLYLFDREIMPFPETLAIGGITIVAEVHNPINIPIDRVEFYLIGPKDYEYEPRAVLYEPPYEWKWNERAIITMILPAEITVGVYYGNAGAVAVDKIEIRIINLMPLFSVSSLRDGN